MTNSDGINGRDGQKTLHYVGVRSMYPVSKREVFYCYNEPTRATHGERFDYVIGPFNTKVAADYMAGDGFTNTQCLTPLDAERFVETGSFAVAFDGDDEQEEAA